MSNKLDSFTQIIHSEAELAVWVERIPEKISAFLTRFPDDIKAKLDFSLDSLEIIEAWWLSKYESKDEIKADEDGILLDEAACYLGDTFRRLCGGEWGVILLPRHLEYRTPLIWEFRVGKGITTMPFTPFYILTAALHRRTGIYISSVVKKYYEDSLKP